MNRLKPFWVLVLIGLLATPSRATAGGQTPDLSQLSIDDLLNIQMTSASRKEQRPFDVASAYYVITHDDIRRSGLSSIPDLLRLAPGVNVAQFNSNKWAVSVRGFNGLYANKLLVLIDGRSIYTRIFSGVFWDAEDLMLDDIERIEVIRGPGAALWGANAVNGVINIVTKAAVDTQGLLVRGEGGRVGEQGAIRYGGLFGPVRYRVYSQFAARNESVVTPGVGANDASHNVTTGFRADWTRGPNAFTMTGDVIVGETRPLWLNIDPRTAATQPVQHVASQGQKGHLLARWTRKQQNGSSLQVQSFLDLGGRQEVVGDYDRKAYDVDTQYNTRLGARHDLVAGFGYRYIDESLAGSTQFSLVPAENRSSLVTGFVQDEIQIVQNRFSVTLGTQVQYDTDSGTGVQPTARAMWKLTPKQRLWFATSRALRTPSLADRGIVLTQPPTPHPSGLQVIATIYGNEDAKSESLNDIEAGYRVELGPNASLDVTAFAGQYDNLVTRELRSAVPTFTPFPHIKATVEFDNLLKANTRGFEVSGQWTPMPGWKLEGSYTGFDVTPKLAPTSQDSNAGKDDGFAPKSQWRLRSSHSIGTRGTVDANLFRVGKLETFQVPAYTRLDLSGEWQLTSSLSLNVIGQHLLDESRAEFANVLAPLQATETPRSVTVRLRWRLR